MASGFCVASYEFEGLDGGFFFICDIFLNDILRRIQG